MAAIAFLDRRADGALAQAAIFATMFTLAALPSCLPWLAFGGALKRFLRAPRARRVLNGAIAALLAASTVLLVNPPLTTRRSQGRRRGWSHSYALITECLTSLLPTEPA